MPDILRGEVYYVYPNYAEVGSEQWAGRPAVVVSADVINCHSQCVEVVYLTTKPKTDYETHAMTNATGRPSTVICEQITSVDKSRLGSCGGRCSAKEMAKIDEALRFSLGLSVPEENAAQEAAESGVYPTPAAPAQEDDADLLLELARSKASLEAYKSLCTDLLDRLSSTVRRGA